jgi:hypothetical protein
MTTKAIPVVSGRASKKDRSAFNPPADAPMPTMVNPCSLLGGELLDLLFDWVRCGWDVREDCFLFFINTR